MRIIISILAIILIFPYVNSISGHTSYGLMSDLDKEMAIENYNLRPLAFTENRGQWDEKAKFKACAGGANMWFTDEGVYYQFIRSIEKEEADPDDPFILPHERLDQEPDSFEQLVLKASFVGANPNPAVFGKEQMEYKCNYFIGNNPDQWHTDVPNYQAVHFREIYPGIDLKYYGNGKQMEYDFIVSPGSDYAQIQIQYEGAKFLSINSSGELVVGTDWGNVVEQKPIVYQMDGSSRRKIDGEYIIADNNTFSFELNGSYNPDLPLVIDPMLVYSTYLGGSDDDWGYDIKLDYSGCAYVTGCTFSGDFPAYNSYSGNYDVYITKISNTGNSLIYSTFLGGTDVDDYCYIALDSIGSAYVTGFTNSIDFPLVNPYQSIYQGGYWDGFVSKLSTDGNSLIYSTYLGGSESDDGLGIAVDASGCAYVTGQTYSTDFPVVNPYQKYQGIKDAFITKFSSAGNSLIYSTYLGGSERDGGRGIALDTSGCAYVTGKTESTDFPTINPYQTNQDDDDVFVTKLSSAGNSLIYSTYLGGNNDEYGGDIAVDAFGCAFVTGYTNSTDFPTINPYQTDQDTTDVFITKLSSTGSSIIYSTYLGGEDGDFGYGIALDTYGCAYVTGWTRSTGFPTVNPFQTDQGRTDVFVSRLSSAGSSLTYSTYLGGDKSDCAWGIALDDSGFIYLSGFTYSTNHPTINPFQYDRGGCDAFITKISLVPNPKAVIAIDRSGSMSLTNPMGQSRLVRAKLMAHDEIDQLLDFADPDYPGIYQIAVMSFNADGIVLVQDFTDNATDLHAAIDAIQSPRHDTPLAAAMCQAHCMLNDLDALAKYVFTYTDGLENESQNFDICEVCEPCNSLMGTGWNYDCDPSNPSSCTDWQMCLHDQFAQTGINIVHYFGEPINPFVKGLHSGLEDMYFLKNTAEVSDGEFLYHSDHATICGDVNSDGSLNVSDAIYLIIYIFQGGAPPAYIPSADCNCDGNVNISDAVNIINHIFLNENAPCDTDGNGEPDC